MDRNGPSGSTPRLPLPCLGGADIEVAELLLDLSVPELIESKLQIIAQARNTSATSMASFHDPASLNIDQRSMVCSVHTRHICLVCDPHFAIQPA